MAAALQSTSAGGHPSPPTFAALLRGTPVTSEEVVLKAGGQHKGEPALFFSDQEVIDLSGPLKFALVGKFLNGQPSMAFLRRGFETIGFKGDYIVGHLADQHVFIRFAHEEDYQRCWLHGAWRFKKHIMKVLKWGPSFSPTKEPPLAPIWISLDQLPLYLFAKGPLFSIGSLIGRPMKIDQATASLTRPSTARVCVEVELDKPLPSRVWIGAGSTGFWQPITYENLPSYCSLCYKIGHSQGNCSVEEPFIQQEWLPKKPKKPAAGSQPKVPKQPQSTAMENPLALLKDLGTASAPPHKPEGNSTTPLNDQLPTSEPSSHSPSSEGQDHALDSNALTADHQVDPLHKLDAQIVEERNLTTSGIEAPISQPFVSIPEPSFPTPEPTKQSPLQAAAVPPLAMIAPAESPTRPNTAEVSYAAILTVQSEEAAAALPATSLNAVSKKLTHPEISLAPASSPFSPQIDSTAISPGDVPGQLQAEISSSTFSPAPPAQKDKQIQDTRSTAVFQGPNSAHSALICNQKPKNKESSTCQNTPRLCNQRPQNKESNLNQSGPQSQSAQMQNDSDTEEDIGYSTPISNKFTQAELILLDAVQYIDPRTGIYTHQQDTTQIDAQEDVLTEVNVEEGDLNVGFITVKSKKRGRGRPRKNRQ